MKYLLLLLLVFSCNRSVPNPDSPKPPEVVTETPSTPTPQPEVSGDSPSSEPTPVPLPQEFVQFEEVSFKEFTPAEVTRLRKIMARGNEVFLQPDFESEVVNYYNPILKKNRYYGSVKESSLTNKESYDIMFAKNIPVELIGYCDGSSTTAYTRPSVSWVRINKCHSNFKSDKAMFKTLCHEASHKRGFIHHKNWSPKRDTSFPYVLGSICLRRY